MNLKKQEDSWKNLQREITLPWNECNDTLDVTAGGAMLGEIPIDSYKNSKTTENYNIDDVVTGVIRGGFVGNDTFNI